jgi:hypothetical protein
MTKKVSLATLRRLTATEEMMLRAVMPRTSEQDATPLAPSFAPAPGEVVSRRSGSRLVRPLTYTLSDLR